MTRTGLETGGTEVPEVNVCTLKSGIGHTECMRKDAKVRKRRETRSGKEKLNGRLSDKQRS